MTPRKTARRPPPPPPAQQPRRSHGPPRARKASAAVTTTVKGRRHRDETDDDEEEEQDEAEEEQDEVEQEDEAEEEEEEKDEEEGEEEEGEDEGEEENEREDEEEEDKVDEDDHASVDEEVEAASVAEERFKTAKRHAKKQHQPPPRRHAAGAHRAAEAAVVAEEEEGDEAADSATPPPAVLACVRRMSDIWSTKRRERITLDERHLRRTQVQISAKRQEHFWVLERTFHCPRRDLPDAHLLVLFLHQDGKQRKASLVVKALMEEEVEEEGGRRRRRRVDHLVLVCERESPQRSKSIAKELSDMGLMWELFSHDDFSLDFFRHVLVPPRYTPYITLGERVAILQQLHLITDKDLREARAQEVDGRDGPHVEEAVARASEKLPQIVYRQNRQAKLLGLRVGDILRYDVVNVNTGLQPYFAVIVQQCIVPKKKK